MTILARMAAWWWEPPEAAPWRSPHPVPEDVGQLGEAAKRLLDDPVLQLALDRMQSKLVDSWKSTALGESASREAAYRMLWTLEQFKSELRVMIGNAAMAQRRRVMPLKAVDDDRLLGNTSGLTNKELLFTALEALVREVEQGLVAQQTLERARYALAAVRRPRRPKAE